MTKDDVQKILNQHPSLCTNGFGPYLLPDREPVELLASERAAMLTEESVRQCTAVEKWLSRCKKRTSVLRRDRTSYTLKHMIEGLIGYVTNGAFIVAALQVGLTVKPVPRSPNPMIAVDLATAIHL